MTDSKRSKKLLELKKDSKLEDVEWDASEDYTKREVKNLFDRNPQSYYKDLDFNQKYSAYLSVKQQLEQSGFHTVTWNIFESRAKMMYQTLRVKNKPADNADGPQNPANDLEKPQDARDTNNPGETRRFDPIRDL